jgi:uncharacterized protein YndB with AHSA1/START domain
MASSQIAHDHDAVQVEIFIAAPPARVFQAITDPAQTTQWWGEKGRYRVIKSHADPRPGGTWYTSGIGADGTEFSVSGTYLEVDPPRLLVHTWNPGYSKLHETTVRWELESQDLHGLHGQSPHRLGTGTLVRVRHSGFAGNVDACKSHGDGWVRVLSWMQQFVEEGKTIETR